MTQSVGIDAADALLELAVREIWTLFIFFFSLFPTLRKPRKSTAAFTFDVRI